MDYQTDPLPPAWTEIELPKSWPDELRLLWPWDLWRFMRKALLRRLNPVQLAEGLPLNVALPKYILQEFHNLPNGNYSRMVSSGYSKGFDQAMLGTLREERRLLAKTFKQCKSVLDVGCGGGHSTQALHEQEITDVWGLDASPYLLQHAARRYPQLKFVQGLAEQTTFPAQRFDGITACFVFHELPPKYADAALIEFRRILKPGGLIAFLEPAIEQLQERPWILFKKFGWRGIYFYILARFVHEPFVESWHKRNIPEWLDQHGFELIMQETRYPTYHVVARLR
ncbi:MAG: class I SAM-dependent methyltransferase [Gammaproteobacteria bacterium]|nr:class I SAM-dependent methyltransferase [Gammaproteobacteria bacterium]